MRKLAPLFLTTSILAFAAGNALAMGDYNKTKKAPEATTSSTKSMNQATPVNNDSSSTGTMRAGEPVAAAPAVAPTMANTTVSTNNQVTPVNRDSSATGTMRAGEPVTTPMGASSSTMGSYNNGSATVSGSTSATTALANDDKQALSRQAAGEGSTIATEDTKAKADVHANSDMKAKKAKKKVAKADTTTSGTTPMSSSSATTNSTSQ